MQFLHYDAFYVGLSEAQAELNKECKLSKISELCNRSDSCICVVSFSRFTCTAPLVSFAWKFNVMTKKLNSGIFHATWILNMKKAKTNPDMSISDIEERVWTPTFECCQKILDQLQQCSMTLADVDRYFKNYTKWLLETNLKLLFKGVVECLEQRSQSDDWICPVVGHIEKYRKLRSYHNAAKAFLDLKHVLKLTKGDYTEFVDLSNEVILYAFLENID